MPKHTTPPKIQAGDVFHDLTVVELHHQDTRWRRHYLCRCKCGTEKVIQGGLLTSGNTKSCGCLKREKAREKCLPHGTAAMRQVIAGYKDKAKKAGIEYKLTVPQFRAIAEGQCFYCGKYGTNTKKSPHGSGDYSYNGLDKIEPTKGYVLSNVVSACKRCNFAKSNMSQGEFMQWIRTAYNHLKQSAMAQQWGRI